MKNNKLEKIKAEEADVAKPEAVAVDEFDAVDEPVDEVKEEVDQAIEKDSGKKVAYKLRNGQIRVFSEAIHGKKYKEIAKGFKNNGKKLVVAEL